MPRHVIDPLTVRQRARLHKLRGYIKSVEGLQEHNLISALVKRKRLPEGLQRIARRFAAQGKEEVLLRQALFINRFGAEITDALLDATKKIKTLESLPIHEKNLIWEEQYSKSIELLLGKIKAKQGDAITSAVDGIEKYLRLPAQIDSSRKTNWGKIKNKINEIERKRIDPNKNFMEEIIRLTSKKKTGQTLAAKAVEVCTAASLYADLMKRKGNTWIVEYREAMQEAYPLIKEVPGLAESILILK